MLRNDPLWFKDAIIYELHVRAFQDSIGDGVGDFHGLTQKLDYLQDLGITAIWLLPFYPSPLRDDGYDIADYTHVHPDYGNLEMFREFLEAAHARGLRVITELVINHTSDQHPWFQRARRAAPGTVERDFYVWSETPDRYLGARIIFKDFESSNWAYDNVAKAYYWHRFYSHQPDLNYENPAVCSAILPIIDYWFEMGVDGLRLDAVPYLFEREGTNCENLPETHAYLKCLRKHVEERFPDRMLLAEANQWPEDAAAYFGNGDECHMAFHFPVMPRLFMGMHAEDRFPIVDILQQTPPIPENCQWALFLRNHDELTLEMVSDEERDQMYRAFAYDRRARINLGIRRRLAPLLGNNRRRMELLNALLFSLPGTPVIYYGDEIGMGDNIYLGDRNGVRTPMQWSADRNAGFSRANPQKLYLPINIDPEYHFEAINVEAQQANPSSLLWWNKRMIALRQRHRAFSRGTIDFLDPHNRKILAFVRRFEDECVLVVANLSRFVQYVELDLSRFDGITPLELFGSTLFPAIGKLPYLLTLGPNGFYWFSLCPRHVAEVCGISPDSKREIPRLDGLKNWEELFESAQIHRLKYVIRDYLHHLSMGDNGRRIIRDLRIRDSFRLVSEEFVVRLLLVDVEYNAGEPETLPLPLTFASGELADQPAGSVQPTRMAILTGPSAGVIYVADRENSLHRALFSKFVEQRSLRGKMGGEIVAWSTASLRDDVLTPPLPISVIRTEQDNHSVTYDDRWILKLLRRVEEGPHPEVEMGRILLKQAETGIVPALVGGIEYRRRGCEPMTLAVLHEFVPHETSAWQYTLDVVSNYLEHTSAITANSPSLPLDYVLASNATEPAEAVTLFGDYADKAGRLGHRLAELHDALSKSVDNYDFAPEAFTMQYQRAIFQSMRGSVLDFFEQLQRSLPELPKEAMIVAKQVIERESSFLKRNRMLLEHLFPAMRIRVHGDCHLGQILYTGKGFTFVDFEGDPGQSLGKRRIKRSPLRDVVGILRSFDYAIQSVVLGLGTGRSHPPGVIRESDRAALAPWAEFFHQCASRRFLQAYFANPSTAQLHPSQPQSLQRLLSIFVQDQLILESARELRLRSDWLTIPLRRLSSMGG